MTNDERLQHELEARIRRVMLATVDPRVLVDGRSVPALVTLLYSVCENNEEKYEKVCRFVELFVREARLDVNN